MKRSKFIDEQILAIVKEGEAGRFNVHVAGVAAYLDNVALIELAKPSQAERRSRFMAAFMKNSGSLLFSGTNGKSTTCGLRALRPALTGYEGSSHNLSPIYTLTLARFEFIVQDCVAKDECHEQGRGHAEVIREVKPIHPSARSVARHVSVPQRSARPGGQGQRAS